MAHPFCNKSLTTSIFSPFIVMSNLDGNELVVHPGNNAENDVPIRELSLLDTISPSSFDKSKRLGIGFIKLESVVSSIRMVKIPTGSLWLLMFNNRSSVI